MSIKHFKVHHSRLKTDKLVYLSQTIMEPYGAGSALPKRGCLVAQDAFEWCRRLRVDNPGD